MSFRPHSLRSPRRSVPTTPSRNLARVPFAPAVVLVCLVVLGLMPWPGPGVTAAEPQRPRQTVVVARSDTRDAGVPEDPFADEDPFERAGPEAPPELDLPDPLEPWNRAMFQFNDSFYFYVVKPASRGYRTVTSAGVRTSVRNFFENLHEPIYIVNSTLQGRPGQAGDAVMRLLINTTLGVGGLFDPARGMGYAPATRTLDQTFGKAGIGPGFYLVWPLLGPSSPRGTVGFVGDRFLYVLTYTEFPVAAGATALQVVNLTAIEGNRYEELKRYSLDPYVALKNVYERRLLKQRTE